MRSVEFMLRSPPRGPVRLRTISARALSPPFGAEVQILTFDAGQRLDGRAHPCTEDLANESGRPDDRAAIPPPRPQFDH